METPKPNEFHEQLRLLAGEWVGQETLYPSEFDPRGGSALGRYHG